MKKNNALKELKEMEPDFLEPAKKKSGGHTTYICPECGNGSGKDGTGIALNPHDPGKHYHCFKCGLHEDIIGLWKTHNSITDDREAFRTLYEHYGLQVDGDSHYINTAKNDFKQNQPTEPKEEKAPNYMNYFRECNRRSNETLYFEKRGISKKNIHDYVLGYDPHYRKNLGGKEWRAIIIPTSQNSYIARNTDPNAEKKNRYRKVGSSHLFNICAIRKNESPLFIVEGEIDALSIIEVGGQAIGLGTTANYKQLLERFEAQPPQAPIILALDNDEAGKETTEKLADGLTALDLSFYRSNLYGNNKDANALLLSNRDVLKKNVVDAIEEAINEQNAKLETERIQYQKTSAFYHVAEFLNGISEGVGTPFIPTGFKNLDKALDGGLFEGLYILGAISSLGKTTLALQMADQIAQAGQDVLIFSLEMARTELMAKSISRHTLLGVMENGGNIEHAKTTRGITTSSRYEKYSETEKTLITQSAIAYREYADHIFIHEGIGDIGAAQIRAIVKKHIHITGNKPVVLIDYVQILAPADIRASDKQNTDKAVLELKRISRDFKIPILGISSFNRASYSTAVTMEAFKESGSLEYGSDVLMGLQLKGIGGKDFDVDAAKNENPRKIDLVILKNRNGGTGKHIAYEYYPLFNYFTEKQTEA
jgi:replicative DNA helicase